MKNDFDIKINDFQEEINSLMGGMTRRIINELKNPISAIKGFTALLEQDISNKKVSKNHLTKILASIDRLEEIINEVSIFSEPKAGISMTVDLQSEIRKILPVFNEIKNLKITTSFSNNDVEVQIYPYLFEQAFKLIIYKLKHHTNQLQISVKKFSQKGQVLISFSPASSTIHSLQLDKLSLSIIKNILNFHGGRLQMNTANSMIGINLPLHVA